MHLALDLDDFDPECVHFARPVVNTVLDNSRFHRVIYTDDVAVFSGVTLYFPLKVSRRERGFGMNKNHFSPAENSDVIEIICSVEKSIMERVCTGSKTHKLRISEQLSSGVLKLADTGETITWATVLKISGVWDNQSTAGLTFRFFSALGREEREADVHHD